MLCHSGLIILSFLVILSFRTSEARLPRLRGSEISIRDYVIISYYILYTKYCIRITFVGMFFKRITIILLFVVIAALLVARLQLGQFRYFDGDEFAHLQWTYLLSIGQVPYRQFFMNFTPVYFWTLTPMFHGQLTHTIPLFARFVHFILYCLIVGIGFALTQSLGGSILSSELAAIFFLTFPVTFDKSIEIRQDFLMVFLLFLSLLLLLRVKKWTGQVVLLVGFLIGVTYLVLLKAIFAIPTYAYLIFLKKPRLPIKLWPLALIGVLLPWILFGLYLNYHNLWKLSWDTIILGSSAIKTGEGSFSVLKTLSPYPYVYLGNGGVSLPWQYSSILWIGSLLSIIILLVKKSLHAAIVISLMLGGGLVAVYLFPTPYTQYFIPFSLVSSISLALGITALLEQGKKIISPTPYHVLTFLAVCGILIIPIQSFLAQYNDRMDARNANTEQLEVLKNVLTKTRTDETIYDMVGSYVFRKPGYQICCNIYSSFIHLLNPRPENLKESLVFNQTKFLILDRQGLSLWRPLADDLLFMKTNYLAAPVWKFYYVGWQFRCNKGVCIHYNLDNLPVTDLARNKIRNYFPEQYRLETIPPKRALLINKKLINTVSPFRLEATDYNLEVPIDITEIKIILDR